MSWRWVRDGAGMEKSLYERSTTDGWARVRLGGGVRAHRPILPLRGGSRPMPVQGRPADRSPATGGPMGAGTLVDRAIRNRFVTADAHARTPGSAQSTDARTG